MSSGTGCLRIAQVAPLYESVPPPLYGGTERIVSYLTEELVRGGHEVTLFASGDSQTKARLVAGCPRALRLDEHCVDKLAPHLTLLEQVFARASEFDVIHFHCDYVHFPWSKHHPCCHVTTLHGRLDIPELPELYRAFPKQPVISISDSQRRPLPWINWQATVYHGLPEDLYRFNGEPEQYLAFLGRVSPEKGVDRAIEIAGRSGMPLKIASKVDAADRAYYEEKIEPLLQKAKARVEFVGEIGDREKNDFLGKATALVFPIDWPEPFGLVMIEALACGTPVIAYPNGSVVEVLEDGATGFLVEDVAQAVRAVGRLGQLERRLCREVFEKRFSAGRMAHDYLAVYRRLLEQPRRTVAGETAGRRHSEARSAGRAKSGEREVSVDDRSPR